jgi:DNA-binding protein HU-beta
VTRLIPPESISTSIRMKHSSESGSKSKPLTKRELFAHFRKKLGLTLSVIREFFSELERLAQSELKHKGEFEVPGLMRLVVQKRKTRMGRNPATGESIRIPPKATLKARSVRL